MKKYAVYKGDTFICAGTGKECAKHLNVKVDSIYFYASPAYKKRLEARKATNAIEVFKMDEEDDCH